MRSGNELVPGVAADAEDGALASAAGACANSRAPEAPVHPLNAP